MQGEVQASSLASTQEREHAEQISLEDVHGCLAPLVEATRRTRARIAVLPVPMTWKQRSWLRGRRDLVVRVPVFVLAHLRMAQAIWAARDNDLVLVREFLSPFTLLVWPLLWPLRRRTYFMNHHNLQAARRSKLERICLSLLLRAGLRLAVLDSAVGLEALGIRADPPEVLVLPFPSAIAPSPDVSGTDGGEPVVGVVGAMRQEKRSEALLAALASLRDAGKLRAHLLLGCPESAVRERWRQRCFEVVDTGRGEDYLATLRRCDVVVLNYDKDRYYHRSSGVIADAVNSRAVVVCPDFPVFREQVSNPVTVGVVYHGLDGLEPALREALALRSGFTEALERYEAERGVEATARRLDDFVAQLS